MLLAQKQNTLCETEMLHREATGGMPIVLNTKQFVDNNFFPLQLPVLIEISICLQLPLLSVLKSF